MRWDRGFFFVVLCTALVLVLVVALGEPVADAGPVFTPPTTTPPVEVDL